MKTVKSADGVVTVYINNMGGSVDVSIFLKLPAVKGFCPARDEGFQFMLDKKTALEFAEELVKEVIADPSYSVTVEMGTTSTGNVRKASPKPEAKLWSPKKGGSE